MPSAWGLSWRLGWGNSWGSLVRHASRPVPAYRGNPLSILDEIKRGKIVDRLVVIQLGIWRDEFQTWLPVFLTANAPWLAPEAEEIASSKVAEVQEEAGREWFDRIMAGDARIEDMHRAPNPYIESYKQDFAAFSAVVNSISANLAA